MLLTNAGGMLGAAIAPGALCAEAGGLPLETGRKLNSSARLVAMEMNACHLAASGMLGGGAWGQAGRRAHRHHGDLTSYL